MSTETFGITELISKIQKEGILDIEQKRVQIINKAKAEADNIINISKKEAAMMQIQCEEHCNHQKQHLDDELKIATRDFLLKFSKTIKISLFQPMIKNHLKDAINNNQFFKNILVSILEKILDKNSKNILIVLNEDKKHEMIEFFSNDLFKNLTDKNNVNISFSDHLEGFQIVNQDEKLIWDFTLDSLTQEIGKLVEPELIKYFI